MLPNQKLLMFLAFVSAIDTAFTKINLPARRRQDEKLLLRTKRQHCTCLNVRVSTGDAPVLGPGLDALDSTYRCSCNSATNPSQQQRELQRILQQIEPLSHCSCSPGGLTGAPPVSYDSPLFGLQQQLQQWDCNCIGGQTQRPTPPQFFPWNQPVTTGLMHDPQSPIPGVPNQPAASLQPFYNELPTTLSPPSPAIPPSLPSPGPQSSQYADSPIPTSPVLSEPQYRNFNLLNNPPRPYQNLGQYPIQQNQIGTFNLPESNGIVESYASSSSIPKCPCMEVIISVTQTDANGNRYPAVQPICVCSPSASPILPFAIRPAPLPIANNEPIRQPLVPPQPQFQPPVPTQLPAIPPRPTPVPTAPITPAPRIPQTLPTPLPVVNQQPFGNLPYEPVRQPYRPPPAQYSPYYSPIYSLGDEPAIMPCVMTITIGGLGSQKCRCQENYRQCSPTHCCNRKSYRSLRADPATTATPSAVDLLLEFADRFKKHLESQQNK